MITLDRATITVGGRRDQTVAVSNLSASFPPGQVTALIGGDGAGKSTLLRTLASTNGRRRLGIAAISPNDVAYQGPGSGVWPNLSVNENLDFMARTYGVADAKPRIDMLIEAADLTHARDRIGSRLSGGMRRKLGTIMAMLPGPQLLLLDEPTTGVDPESRATLWELIQRAASEGAAVIVATTYVDEAERADHVLLLDHGTLLASGSAAQVIACTPGEIWSQPLPGDSMDEASAGSASSPFLEADHPRVWQRGRELFEWRPDGAHRVLPAAHKSDVDLDLSTIAFLLANESAGERQDDAPHEVEARANPSTGALQATLGSPQALISCHNVRKKFGRFTAVRGASVDLFPGEVVGLVGGNGAGKSTLIRLILGLEKPNAGKVELCGASPNAAGRARVGYVPQALGLYPTLSASANAAFVTTVFGVERSEAIDQVIESLAQTYGKAPIASLPLGAQRVIAVECALSHGPDLLILDEPTSGMDALERARLWQRIRHAANRGIGVLVTTHYQHEAAQCDRLIRMHAGRIVTNDDGVWA